MSESQGELDFDVLEQRISESQSLGGDYITVSLGELKFLIVAAKGQIKLQLEDSRRQNADA